MLFGSLPVGAVPFRLPLFDSFQHTANEVAAVTHEKILSIASFMTKAPFPLKSSYQPIFRTILRILSAYERLMQNPVGRTMQIQCE
ncbi:hypothetical protein [Candidatus Methylacidithermus pantelleriae]|uniref:Uncharacterized protein n=1 Tax=Candidatus Methylacidithermus pantelleriae TaxID=2744239 RepID=A0A8J2BQG1_9BACT|nr:hypothetical protein [Candidatus Methylacidithermus pantelleriae]CAF0701881.1 hypothetical protein MPNT_430006 [Candidatus Methylacidithermus pantelleriae]